MNSGRRDETKMRLSTHKEGAYFGNVSQRFFEPWDDLES